MKAAPIKLLGLLLVISSCCPKITELPVVIQRDTIRDSIYIQQPPIIIPADEFEIGYSIQEICDSTWRADHPEKKASGKRLQGRASITTDSLKFRCHEAELRIQVDSLLKIVEQIREKETHTKVIEVCPRRWPGWIHGPIFILAVIGLISTVIFVIRWIPKPPGI